MSITRYTKRWYQAHIERKRVDEKHARVVALRALARLEDAINTMDWLGVPGAFTEACAAVNALVAFHMTVVVMDGILGERE